MGEEEKASFWKEMGDAKGAAERDRAVMNTLKDRVIESRISGSKGEYLPLGFYKKQGYDWKRIRDTCEDVQDHPNLGKTYRVDIMYQDKKKEAQRVRDEILQSIQDKKAASNVRATEGARGQAKEGVRTTNPRQLCPRKLHLKCRTMQ